MINNFKKSSKCGTSTCVEVKFNLAAAGKSVTVRDAEGNEVLYSVDEWRAFIEGVKLGEFDI